MWLLDKCTSCKSVTFTNIEKTGIFQRTPKRDRKSRDTNVSDESPNSEQLKVNKDKKASNDVDADKPKFKRNSDLSVSSRLNSLGLTSRAESISKYATVPILDLDTDLFYIETVGEGAFGVVELCSLTQPDSGEEIKVVVKKMKAVVETTNFNEHMIPVIQKIKCGVPQVDMFERECRLQAWMQHANIVSVLGMGTYFCEEYGDELPFMVQEYMPRQLTGVLQTRYKVEQAITWCLQIAKALEYMHSSEPILIHRDIKPDNILLTEDNVAKVADLGLFTAFSSHPEDSAQNRQWASQRTPSGKSQPDSSATREDDIGECARVLSMEKNGDQDGELTPGMNPSSEEKSQSSSGLNSPVELAKVSSLIRSLPPKGTICPTGKTGSLRYMAPENYRGDLYSNKVDQYSFAMLMYAILDHGEPFHKDNRYTPDQIACAASKPGGLRPPLRKTWPQSVQTLMQECWDHEPSRRPSFADIVARLERILREHLVKTGSKSSQCTVA